MSDRKPYPLFNAFRPFVMNELTRRKTHYPTPIVAPFVRMTSCMADDKIGYAFFTLGLHGFNATDLNIFDVTYGNRRDIVGYAYDINGRDNTGRMKRMLISSDQLTAAPLTPTELNAINPAAMRIVQQDQSDVQTQQNTLFALGTHPIPGITNISISRRGVGTPQIAKVVWTCYNRAQLEFLRNHFLVTGGHVVIEWGNQFSNKQTQRTLDFADDQTTRQVLVRAINEGRSYIIDQWVEPNGGNYDFIVGAVGNFQIDIDAQSGIYTCTTEIYSVGEQMWGLNNHTTYVNKNIDASGPRILTTINDFFAVGSAFDLLVQKYANDSGSVAFTYANWARNSKQTNEQNQDLRDFSTNPDDYHFISWTFFVKTVIPMMFSLISDENVKSDLNNFNRFYSTDEEWIGNNVFLRSVDPDTMLIIQSDMKITPSAFLGAGYFDQHNNQTDHTRGKLDHGIWLNTGMLRTCFQGSNNFMDGVRSVLMRMNNASAQFWQLQLYWDDEINKYRVIDGKFQVSAHEQPAFYKFNVGGQGELLNLNLDSAFPPALITQMALFAKFKTETLAKKEELLKNYPSIGTTSTFIFSLNWTNLRDILDIDLQRSKVTDGTPQPLKIALSTSDPSQDNPTVRSRVAPAIPDALSGIVTFGGSPQEGQAVNVVTPQQASSDLNGTDFDGTGALRKSPNPAARDATRVSITNLEDPTSTDLSRLDGAFKDRYLRVKNRLETEFGLNVLTYETYRSQERQNYLYSKGRDGRNSGPPVTWTLNSRHTLGLAVDVILTKPPSDKEINESFFPTLAKICQEEGVDTLGYEGGAPRDPRHIQSAGRVPQALWNQLGETSGSVEQGANEDRFIQQQTDAQELEKKAKGISTRFGKEMISMIELQPSAMVAHITHDGFVNYPKSSNGFVTGFPTTTAVEVEILGISGISITDGFFVDKIPFIFERHGVFQVTEITDSIKQDGWTTSVRGYFKLVWLEGTGPEQKPIEMFVG